MGTKRMCNRYIISECFYAVRMAYFLNTFLKKLLWQQIILQEIIAGKALLKKRSQGENPKTNLMTKRNTEDGKYMDVKTSGTKFKGVRKEK